jgi:hypothetical protein
MPRLIGIGALLAMSSLGACALDNNAWFVSRYKEQAPFLFEPDRKPREVDPAPDAKALIAGNLAQVFGHTKVQDVQLAPPRRSGPMWTACVRAEISGITGQSLGRQYFVVEFDRGQIGLRRPATRDDNCESEPFAAI